MAEDKDKQTKAPVAAAVPDLVYLECVYANGRYPKLGLIFHNGQAKVSKEEFEKLKKHKLFGREFGERGKFKGTREARVQVTRGAASSGRSE